MCTLALDKKLELMHILERDSVSAFASTPVRPPVDCANQSEVSRTLHRGQVLNLRNAHEGSKVRISTHAPQPLYGPAWRKPNSSPIGVMTLGIRTRKRSSVVRAGRHAWVGSLGSLGYGGGHKMQTEPTPPHSMAVKHSSAARLSAGAATHERDRQRCTSQSTAARRRRLRERGVGRR